MLFLFAEAFKNTRNFKISIERINLHLTFISFCSFFLGKKSGIQETDEKRAGCGILAKTGRECGIRTPTSNSVH